MRVSYAPNGHNYRLVTQNGFGGINNNIGAEEGEILSSMNMSADAYPVLSTRKEGLEGVALPKKEKKLYKKILRKIFQYITAAWTATAVKQQYRLFFTFFYAAQ